MRHKEFIILLILSAVIGLAAAGAIVKTFEVPQGWPAPSYDFNRNPLNSDIIEIGHHLFYDPILSLDSSIACVNCHLSYTAFTHVDHALSHGIDDSIGTRNSLSLMNLAWSSSFMWDGAVNHLDMQALAPISHSSEMGSDFAMVVAKINEVEHYQLAFQEAFHSSEVTGEHVLKALAQFQLTLVSSNSKYDQVMRQELGVEFSEQELRGYELFQADCATCHQEPLFSSGEFKNNGLPMDTILQDLGRMGVTGSSSDSLRFKVPTLRNIEFSKPYMHDGRFRTLGQVIDHYRVGIQSSPSLAAELENGISMSDNDKADLIAFLLTLSDREFLFDPRFSFPKKSIGSEG